MIADRKPWGWVHALVITLALVALQLLWRQAPVSPSRKEVAL